METAPKLQISVPCRGRTCPDQSSPPNDVIGYKYGLRFCESAMISDRGVLGSEFLFVFELCAR